MSISDTSGDFLTATRLELILSSETLPLTEAFRIHINTTSWIYLRLHTAKSSTFEEKDIDYSLSLNICLLRCRTGKILRSLWRLLSREATGDQDLSLQLMNSRTDLANYDCYEAAVKHYDTYCYDISQVRINIML